MGSYALDNRPTNVNELSKDLIVLHNILARKSTRWNALELKLFYAVISQIRIRDDKNVIRLKKADICDILEIDKTHSNKLREQFVKMMQKSFVQFDGSNEQEWKDGFLDIPYCSCTSSDLFNEYIRWCERNNEFKKRNRDFVAEVRRVLVYSRHDLMLNSMSRRTQRVFVSEDDYKHCLDKDYVKRIDESCMRFKDAIATRRNPNGD